MADKATPIGSKMFFDLVNRTPGNTGVSPHNFIVQSIADVNNGEHNAVVTGTYRKRGQEPKTIDLSYARLDIQEAAPGEMAPLNGSTGHVTDAALAAYLKTQGLAIDTVDFDGYVPSAGLTVGPGVGSVELLVADDCLNYTGILEIPLISPAGEPDPEPNPEDPEDP